MVVTSPGIARRVSLPAMPSITVENYLKQIFLEQQRDPEALVSPGRLAAVMAVTPGTVTSMVKTLADSGLVAYEPRSGVRLTAGGEQLALHVLRRHRLVEMLLVKVLGLDWSEVHPEAEELEHAISDKVLDKIDDLLGHPKFDPHGDPIPSASGQIIEPDTIRLSHAQAGRSLRIARIEDQEEAFLRFASQNGLTPGAVLTIEQVNTAADSLTIRVKNGPTLTLGTVAAGKILVH